MVSLSAGSFVRVRHPGVSYSPFLPVLRRTGTAPHIPNFCGDKNEKSPGNDSL
jgi:hypothetical protein